MERGCGRFFRRMAAIFTATAIIHAPAIADNDPNSNKSTGLVVLLPGNLIGHNENSGTAIHLPGREYRTGEGWWAFSCQSRCELKPKRLTVSPKAHPEYDGPPVPGQLLDFSPAPEPRTLLLFKPFRLTPDQLKLRAGPLTTYHPGTPSYLKRSTKTQGTFESEVALPDGRLLRFIPTLMLPRPGAPAKQDWQSSSSALALEVHIDGKRQVLGTFSFGIDGPQGLKPSEYVLWVGDLDGDGQPDFLVNLDFAGTGLVLFLSSLAKDGQIVGEAGSFRYFPIESPGC